jgi:hypothetical protein
MLDLPTNVWKNIRELDQVGSHTVEALLMSGLKVRVTARRDLRASGGSMFSAQYERLTDVLGPDGELVSVWTNTRGSFPWARGETVEDCLRSALGWVDEQGAWPFKEEAE